jgi:CcmD family protein
MNKIKNLAAAIALACLSAFVHAQPIANDNTGIMTSNGKIYVVMTVVIVIIVGLFLFLFNLERKIKKLEREYMSENEQPKSNN